MTRFYTFVAAAAVAVSASAAGLEKSPDAMTVHSDVQILDATRSGFNVTPLGQAMTQASLKSDDASQWRSLGMAVYTDAYLTGIQEPEPNTWEVEIQESVSQPGYFKLVKPYAHIAPDGECNDLYIHAEDHEVVYISTQDLGFDLGTGAITAGSIGGSFLEMGASPSDVIYSYGDVFGTFDGHLISFPESSLFYQLDNGGMNVCNIDGRFRVTLPDDVTPGMSATTQIMLADQCAIDGNMRVGVSAEGTYAKILIYVIEGRFNYSENLYSLIASLAVQGEGREVEAEQMYALTVTKPMTVGTAFAVAVDPAGEYIANSGSAVTFIITGDDADNWAPVEGTGSMTDDLIASVYSNVEPSTFDVTVERNIADPALVRVVNPYKTRQWPSYGDGVFCEHNHYLYLDLTDPDKVRLPESGLGVSGDGMIYVYDRVDYAAKNDEDPEQWYGRYDADTRTVTFPAEAILYRELNDPDIYTANRQALFKVVLPVENALDRIEAGDNTPAVYYNLQGIRVDRPESGNLYICRRGAATTKIVMP